MKLRILLLVSIGMTIAPAMAKADGNLGEKSLKDTNLLGAQCTLAQKQILPSASQQAGQANAGQATATEAK